MKIIVIGGNGAGMTCATKLQRNLPASKITVFENSPHVSFGACGLPYYIGNFFTDPNYLFAKTVKELETNNLKVLVNHEVLNINPKNKILEVKNLTNQKTFPQEYDKLVIATGAKAITLNLEGENITPLKTLADAEKIKNYLKSNKVKDIAILGSGYIGLEALEAFSKYNIHIIDLKQNVTDKFLDAEFEEIVNTEIQKHHNITLHLNTSFEKLEISGKKINLSLINNQTKESYNLPVNFLLLALGFTPQSPNIIGNGLRKLKNGAIIINKNGETNIKDIYAVGDCASIWHNVLQKDSYIALATIANKMGKKIADHIGNLPNTFQGTIASSCLKLLNLEIAKTGITEFEAIENKIPYTTKFVTDYNHTNYYPGQQQIFMKILYNSNTRRIIGAQLVGEKGAMLRIHALSIAISVGLSIDELSNVDFAYAPPFTRTWEALNILGAVASKTKPLS